MNVCDNLGDHLVGNVYVKFKREDDAEKAVNDLNNRWFGGTLDTGYSVSKMRLFRKTIGGVFFLVCYSSKIVVVNKK